MWHHVQEGNYQRGEVGQWEDTLICKWVVSLGIGTFWGGLEKKGSLGPAWIRPFLFLWQDQSASLHVFNSIFCVWVCFMELIHLRKCGTSEIDHQVKACPHREVEADSGPLDRERGSCVQTQKQGAHLLATSALFWNSESCHFQGWSKILEVPCDITGLSFPERGSFWFQLSCCGFRQTSNIHSTSLSWTSVYSCVKQSRWAFQL
jgi:hypothetical protein